MMQNPLLHSFITYLKVEKYLNFATIDNRVYEISLFLQYGEAEGLNFCEKHDLQTVDFNKYLKFRYNHKEYSRSYTNKIQEHLVSFYDFLEQNHYIDKNPAKLLERARVERKVPDILSMYEYHLIENHFTACNKDQRDAAIIETLFSSGIRIDECLSLKLDNYSNHETVIGKGDKERIIILNPSARQKIDTYLQYRSVQSEFLFCNASGGKLTRSYVAQMIKNVCQAVGIKKKVSPHSFRHFFATLLLEGGANLFEIKDLLGHKRISTTEIYARTDVRHLREAIKHLPKFKDS